MNLINQHVTYKFYGECVITEYDELNNRITIVSCKDSSKTLKMVFPDAFEEHLEPHSDELLLEAIVAIKEKIERKKEIALANEIVVTEPKRAANDSLINASNRRILDKDNNIKIEVLKNVRAQYRAKIAEIIRRRDIKFLYHFTRVENLESILKHGIVPVALHQELEIEAITNDGARYEKRPDCTCVSVSFPNYRVLGAFIGRDNLAEWCIIEIDSNLLLSDDIYCFFCRTNAARLCGHMIALEKLSLCSSNAFESMFDAVGDNNGIEVNRDELNIADSMTTDPQAEVLIQGIIKPKYIRKIHNQYAFMGRSDKKYWQNEFLKYY